MNVLFIGNSYTYYNDLEKIFEKLCRDNGKQVNAFRVTEGGRRLDAYMDPDDPTTQQLENMLRERHYTVCFLQEQSLLPALDHQAFVSGATHVMRMVGAQADQFVLYATWARKLGSPDLDTYGWSREQMTKILYDSYCKAGKTLNMAVSPVGINFWRVICSHPQINLYHTDLTHPSYLGSCLAALTHYHTLFGQFPETVLLELTEEQTAAFRSAVCA